jgi:hypothetical protein
MSRRSPIWIALEHFAWACLELLGECVHSTLTYLDAFLQWRLGNAPENQRLVRAEQLNVREGDIRLQDVPIGYPVPLRARQPNPNPEIVQGVQQPVQRFYAVAMGRRPGIYTDWSSAAQQVLGFSGNIHKAFNDRGQAEAFLRGHNVRY